MRYARLEPLDLDLDAVQDATAAVVGCGATGSHLAAQLARLGTDLVLIDRDAINPENLASSTLYTQQDVDAGRAKAAAAADHLRRINPDIRVETQVTELHGGTTTLLDGADIVVDGTDNIEARHVINEYCHREGVPWVHVAAVGSRGASMPVVPGETACFHCLCGGVDGTRLATCASAGITQQAAATAASAGVTEAISVLQGCRTGGLTRFDLDAGRRDTFAVARRDNCPVCINGEYPHMDDGAGTTVTALCDDTYHVNPHLESCIEMDKIAEKLEEHGRVNLSDDLIRFEGGGVAFTLFRDGRANVDATSADEARTVYDRFVGR